MPNQSVERLRTLYSTCKAAAAKKKKKHKEKTLKDNPDVLFTDYVQTGEKEEQPDLLY